MPEQQQVQQPQQADNKRMRVLLTLFVLALVALVVVIAIRMTGDDTTNIPTQDAVCPSQCAGNPCASGCVDNGIPNCGADASSCNQDSDGCNEDWWVCNGQSGSGCHGNHPLFREKYDSNPIAIPEVNVVCTTTQYDKTCNGTSEGAYIMYCNAQNECKKEEDFQSENGCPPAPGVAICQAATDAINIWMAGCSGGGSGGSGGGGEVPDTCIDLNIGQTAYESGDQIQLTTNLSDNGFEEVKHYYTQQRGDYCSSIGTNPQFNWVEIQDANSGSLTSKDKTFDTTGIDVDNMIIVANIIYPDGHFTGNLDGNKDIVTGNPTSTCGLPAGSTTQAPNCSKLITQDKTVEVSGTVVCRDGAGSAYPVPGVSIYAHDSYLNNCPTGSTCSWDLTTDSNGQYSLTVPFRGSNGIDVRVAGLPSTGTLSTGQPISALVPNSSSPTTSSNFAINCNNNNLTNCSPGTNQVCQNKSFNTGSSTTGSGSYAFCGFPNNGNTDIMNINFQFSNCTPDATSTPTSTPSATPTNTSTPTPSPTPPSIPSCNYECSLNAAVDVCDEELSEPGSVFFCYDDGSGGGTGKCRLTTNEASDSCQPPEATSTPTPTATNTPTPMPSAGQLCGNNSCDSGETCDGNTQCSGSGIFTPGECRAQIEPSGCTYCGDGILHTGEECDDGNSVDNDSCSNSCTFTPGIQETPTSTPTPTEPGATSTNTPTPAPFCGDGIMQSNEECDTGIENSCGFGIMCNADCTCEDPPTCGNGTVDPGEECDTGLTNSCSDGGSCQPNCTCLEEAPTCGSACTSNEECPANHMCSGGSCRLSACINGSSGTVTCDSSNCQVLSTLPQTNSDRNYIALMTGILIVLLGVLIYRFGYGQTMLYGMGQIVNSPPVQFTSRVLGISAAYRMFSELRYKLNKSKGQKSTFEDRFDKE